MKRGAAVFWLGGLAVFVALLWLLSGILLPFVAGCAIAYFLDPAVDRLERLKVPRGLGALGVLLVFFAGLAVVLMLLLPVIELEGAELARRAPGAIESGREELQSLLEMAQQRLSPEDLAKLKEMAATAAAGAADWAGVFAQRILTSGLALANVLSLIVITPIVSFFLLRDWDQLIIIIDHWLPRRYVGTIRAEARMVDTTLAGFVHGQFLVGVALAIYYGAALSVVGLNFAVILGILIGILSFIPIMGILTAFVLAVGLGLIQFGLTAHFLAILAIFALGYLIDQSLLSPRLVGKRVNLHPVWVIFSLLAFGSAFGLIGVLLAIPAAAVIGVLVRFAIAQYLASSYYDPDRR
jgi:predicted PurR-regulated permease PerM